MVSYAVSNLYIRVIIVYRSFPSTWEQPPHRGAEKTDNIKAGYILILKGHVKLKTRFNINSTSQISLRYTSDCFKLLNKNLSNFYSFQGGLTLKAVGNHCKTIL
jgi:hypothetical protein